MPTKQSMILWTLSLWRFICACFLTEVSFFNNSCLQVVFRIAVLHCIKSVHIRRYSGPHFPAFELNMERYFLVRIFPHSDWIRTDTEYLHFYSCLTPIEDNIFAPIQVSSRKFCKMFENSYFSERFWMAAPAYI